MLRARTMTAISNTKTRLLIFDNETIIPEVRLHSKSNAEASLSLCSVVTYLASSD